MTPILWRRTRGSESLGIYAGSLASKHQSYDLSPGILTLDPELFISTGRIILLGEHSKEWTHHTHPRGEKQDPPTDWGWDYA